MWRNQRRLKVAPGQEIKKGAGVYVTEQGEGVPGAREGDICPTCGCCSLVWEECEQCGGEGVDGHDCGEDTCCCRDPEENIPCRECGGRGGRLMCVGCCGYGAPTAED